MYEYKAKVLRVVDGDTVDFVVDLGFHMSASIRFRVLGVDTPELRGGTEETKEAATQAKLFVSEKLFGASSITVRTQKHDSFGRWLAEVLYTDDDGIEKSLGDELLSEGLAKAYK